MGMWDYPSLFCYEQNKRGICRGWGEAKSLPPFHLKTGAPSHTNFREIEQGDSPERRVIADKYNIMKSKKTV